MSASQYPVIYAGQNAVASLIQALTPLVAYKALDTSRASTTTLTADPDIVFAVPAAGTYILDGYFNYEGGNNGSSDMQIEFTSIGTLRFGVAHNDTSGSGGAPQIATTYPSGTPVGLGTAGAGNLRAAVLHGSLITPSSGTTTLLWAQSTSSATPTILHAGSWVSLRRIA